MGIDINCYIILQKPRELKLVMTRLEIRSRAGWLLFLLALLAGAGSIARVARADTDPWGLRLWLFTLVALPVAGYLLGARANASVPEAAPTPPPWTWPEIVAVLAVIAVGAGLRIYRLDTIPPGIFVDETNAAGDALRILDGWRASPFGVGWFETPLGYIYYMAGLIKLFGPTYYTLKAASLIPALLTLPALYLLGRELFGPRVALAALAFLAFNRWHMTMSRWGWNEVAPPLFHILAVYFLARGSRTRNLGSFALAGVVMGLGMYTYLASRLAVLAILAYIGYRVLVERGYLRRAWQGLLLFLVAYALVFGPLVTTYVRNPFTFLNRSQQVSILNDMKAQYRAENAPSPLVQRALGALGLPTNITFEPLKRSVIKHLRMFHIEGDYNPRHNIPGQPMLDPITGAFFVLGLLLALWRWRDHRYGLLLLWIPIVLLGGILTLAREAPQAYRTLGVVPAIGLLAGDALVRSVQWLEAQAARLLSRSPRALHPYITSFLIALPLALAGWANVDAYFNRWATARSTYAAFSPMETTVAREVAARLSTHTVYLSPTLYWGSPLRYLTYRPAAQGYGLQHPPFQPIQPVEDLPLSGPVAENALFLLEPLYADLLELFTEYYPHTQAELVTSRYGDPLYLRVTIPQADIRAIRGLNARYELDDGTTVERREASIDHAWPEDFPAEVSARRVTRVTWTGSLFIPRSGVYDLRAEGELQVEVDGVPWQGQRMLGKGLHALRVVQERPGESGYTVARLYWQREGEDARPVPGEYFFVVPPPTKGLLGTYYKGEDWQGPPLFTRVDRALFMAWIDPEPVVGPFSVTWTGYLLAPVDGVYQFTAGADDGVRLWLDGKVLGESLRPDTVNQVQVHVTLRAGPHSIRVDYFQRGGAKTFTLRWRPPQGKDGIIPPAFLRPAPLP